MVALDHADSDIEGFIGEDDARDICSHQPSDDGGIGGVSADQTMGAEPEQIVDPSAGSDAGQRRKIASFASILVSADDDLIDLVKSKS